MLLLSRPVLLGLLGLFCAAALLRPLYYRKSRPGGCQLVFSERRFAFHEFVSEGGVQIRHYKLPVKNLGKTEITISKAHVSCGCLALDFPRRVPPFGTALLDATVTIPSGVIDRKIVNIALETNSRHQPVALTDIEINVLQAISFSAESIDFGSVRAGQRSVRPFIVELCLDGAVSSGQVELSNQRQCTWRINEQNLYLRDSREVLRMSGILEVQGQGESGTQTEALSFSFGTEAGMKRSVQCTWTIVPDVQLRPERLILTGSADEEMRSTIILHDRKVGLKALAYDDRLLHASLTAHGEGGSVVVRARAPGLLRVETTVRLITGDGREWSLPVVVLPSL